MNDPISDLLTRVRNANAALLPNLEIPHSKMKESIAQILKREGYISDLTVIDESHVKRIKITLKYQGRKGVIEGLKRISTPGLRRYVGSDEIPRVRNGLGMAILSTSSGILTGDDARRQNVGGELLCFVW